MLWVPTEGTGQYVTKEKFEIIPDRGLPVNAEILETPDTYVSNQNSSPFDKNEDQSNEKKE